MEEGEEVSMFVLPLTVHPMLVEKEMVHPDRTDQATYDALHAKIKCCGTSHAKPGGVAKRSRRPKRQLRVTLRNVTAKLHAARHKHKKDAKIGAAATRSFGRKVPADYILREVEMEDGDVADADDDAPEDDAVSDEEPLEDDPDLEAMLRAALDAIDPQADHQHNDAEHFASLGNQLRLYIDGKIDATELGRPADMADGVGSTTGEETETAERPLTAGKRWAAATKEDKDEPAFAASRGGGMSKPLISGQLPFR